MITLFVLFLIFSSLSVCNGHLRLTFPPARYPSLDFLDNVRTVGPCGVGKRGPGPGTHTNLLAGSTVNITWFMAYPHQGGYKIELLDSEEVFLRVLSVPVGPSGFTGLFDQTREQETVTLPREPCENCVIRIVREAKEWGGNYKFWSCADVNIVDQMGHEERCSRKGTFARGRCYCEPLRSGKFCHFEDECHAHEHCGVGRACNWLSGRSYPRWGCFERRNYFGSIFVPPKSIPLNIFDPRNFKLREVGDGNKIYWQILPESGEIKFVLQFQTKAWVAVGWKPKNLDEQRCKNLAAGINWRRDYGETEPEAESEPASREPVPEPSYEPLPLPESPQQKSAEFSISDFDPGDRSCEGGWEWPQGCAGSQCDYRIKWAYGGGQEEIAFFLETRVPKNNWWTGIGFSKSGTMADADMIILKVEGGLLSLYDMHGVGYAAPRLDFQQDVFTRVTPTIAYSNGRLKAMFGRKLNSGDFANDVIFNSTNCFYFLFPVRGGPLSTGGSIRKHGHTPYVSESAICIQSCTRRRNSIPLPLAENPAKPEPEPRSRSARHRPFDPKSSSHTIPFAEAEPRSFGEPQAEPRPGPEAEPRGDHLHPMDCADIVIAAVEGNYFRIFDYYTVSRATPRTDEFYSGKQSLTASVGFEHNGVTTVMFRKKLMSTDPADHSITPGPMTLIWAHGQEFGFYSHKPNSALESGHSRITDFYEPNTPRYHGKTNRGVLTVDFYKE